MIRYLCDWVVTGCQRSVHLYTDTKKETSYIHKETDIQNNTKTQSTQNRRQDIQNKKTNIRRIIRHKTCRSTTQQMEDKMRFSYSCSCITLLEFRHEVAGTFPHPPRLSTIESAQCLQIFRSSYTNTRKKNIHTNTCPQILRLLGTAPTFELPQAFRFSSVGTLKNPSVFS